MVELQGRVLDAPKLQYGGRVSTCSFNNHNPRVIFASLPVLFTVFTLGRTRIFLRINLCSHMCYPLRRIFDKPEKTANI